MHKLFIVAQREYLKMVKNKAFWASTLLIPVLMLVVSLISGFSSKGLEDKLNQAVTSVKTVLIYDESTLGNFKAGNLPENYLLVDSYDKGVSEIKANNASIFIFYPKDILQTGQIKVVTQDQGVFTMGLYDELARKLLTQTIQSEISDPNKIKILNSSLSVQTESYKDGILVQSGFERFIIPILSIIAYLLFSSIASSYLLQSVSEEKENRMIEIVLSIIPPKDLIMGKVIGQVGAIFTQIFLLVSMAGLVIRFTSDSLPFNLANVTIEPTQIILAIIYLICGFLILAFTMVGVGAAMPTYREASSFSSVFILLSIFPMYFFMMVLAEPTGLLSIVTSYFPYTAPMVLLLRNSLNALSPTEIAISIVTLIVDIFVIAILSYRLFEFGALEYNQKISFKSFLNTFKRK